MNSIHRYLVKGYQTRFIQKYQVRNKLPNQVLINSFTKYILSMYYVQVLFFCVESIAMNKIVFFYGIYILV